MGGRFRVVFKLATNISFGRQQRREEELPFASNIRTCV